jgi:hypothetical protein
VECPGQGMDNRSIIEIVVKTQLQAGYTVSPSGACFTSPFFLLAACLDPEKVHLGKKSESNTGATEKTSASAEVAIGCGASGYETASRSVVARWMDPAHGSFISVDPYAGKVGLPVSQHRYLYARVSPISYGDPSGRILLASDAATRALEGSLRVINITARKSYYTWLTTALVFGALTLNSSADGSKWTKDDEQKWLAETRLESPVRLQHYTNERGKNGIEGSGLIDPKFSKEGLLFFTPNIYWSGSEATEKLATPSELEYFISLFMYPKADGLSEITPVGKRYGHDGGGLEASTSRPIWINSLKRLRSQWIPLTD